MSRAFKGMILGVILVATCMVPNAGAASQTFVLDIDYCGTGCLFGGVGGTVTLSTTPTANQVEIQVVLDSPPDFNSNPGLGGFDTFAFNLSGLPTITFVTAPSSPTIGSTTGSPGATWTPAAGSTQAAGSNKEDGAGHFMYVVNCTNCGQSSGDIATVETLDFTISASSLNLADFIKTTDGSPDSYFALDVFNTSPSGSSCTGIIGSDGSATATTSIRGGSNDGTGACASASTVPEPTAIAFFGTGLIGAGFLLRRRFVRR